MMYKKAISEKKQKLIDKFLASPLKVGDNIYVRNSALYNYGSNKDRDEHCQIVKIDGGEIKVIEINSCNSDNIKTITKNDIIKRDFMKIGVNPFNEKQFDVRSVAFPLDGVIFSLNLLGERRDDNELYDINGTKILEFNWNPFVYNKEDKKEYFQRDFVWKIKDNQLLVHSIYEGIDCGKLLVRLRSWNELTKMQKKGETELAFRDIIDGKQRLYAVQQFILGKFKDLDGNYYGDLSEYAQYRFQNHQLFSYSEMPENTLDADVIAQFLKMNFYGVPQSKEHINFVREISKRL